MVKEKSVIDGKSLIDLRKKISEKFLVCIVERGEEVFIPYGQSVLSAGDKIYVIVTQSGAHNLLKSLGLLQKECKDVIIVGASKTAHYLSDMLVKGRSSVKVIDKAADKCDAFIDGTDNKVTVVHGDAMSQELLIEEGIEQTDALVALTGQDEENILMSIYSVSKKVPKVIAKVNRNELTDIAENLGLDCIISPKNIVSDIIVRYARALSDTIGSKVKTLYSLADGAVEALEFDVTADFDYTGVMLKYLELKKDVLIAGIIRAGKAILPGGDDCIQAGDGVIVIAKGEKIYSLSDIIK
ncbi:MAG TPA: hypothetical protein DDW54_03240 [Clostridiales bacterium]|nr:hypothetical protein [Clostridiales bacterium]